MSHRLQTALGSARNWLTEFLKTAGLWDVLKTFCGEVAVLLVVFPLVDTLIDVDPSRRVENTRWILASIVAAILFLLLAVGFAKKEESIVKERD